MAKRTCANCGKTAVFYQEIYCDACKKSIQTKIEWVNDLRIKGEW
jgi:uncharacterized OB-fold protein